MGAGGLCRCASSSIHLVPLQDAYLQQHRPAEQARMDSSVSQRENRPDLKKQRSHSFPTLYLPPHRCGRNKAGWNLSKYCLLNLPFHFSAGCCCCWFTSAVQTVLSSGQSLLTVLPTRPPCSAINLCAVSQKQTTKARLPLLLPTWFLSGLGCKGRQDDISSCHPVSAAMNTHVETAAAQTRQSVFRVFTSSPSQIRD